MADSGERITPNDEFTADDRSALSWAVSTEHPVGAAIIKRVRSGGAGISVAELAAIHQDWEAAGRPLPERHVHRTRVQFADDTTVTGVTFLADDPYAREDPPGFGLYLDERWAPPWPHVHVDWPDFGVPEDVDVLRRALTDLLDRARTGESVEAGCLGLMVVLEPRSPALLSSRAVRPTALWLGCAPATAKRQSRPTNRKS